MKLHMSTKQAIKTAIGVMESHKDECHHLGRIASDPDTLASLSEEIDKCTAAVEILQSMEVPDESN